MNGAVPLPVEGFHIAKPLVIRMKSVRSRSSQLISMFLMISIFATWTNCIACTAAKRTHKFCSFVPTFSGSLLVLNKTLRSDSINYETNREKVMGKGEEKSELRLCWYVCTRRGGIL